MKRVLAATPALATITLITTVASAEGGGLHQVEQAKPEMVAALLLRQAAPCKANHSSALRLATDVKYDSTGTCA